MRRTMVAGNWKMHGTRASVAELIDGLRGLVLPNDVDVAVFPPQLFIDRVINGLQGGLAQFGTLPTPEYAVKRSNGGMI